MTDELAERIRRLPAQRIDDMISGLGETRLPYINEAISLCYDRTKSAELDINSHNVRQIDIRKAMLYLCVRDGRLVME